MTAIILAGGDGLRLRPLTCSLPKAMLTVCNKPIIGYVLNSLKAIEYTDCIIAADRLSHVITDELDGDIRFSVSETPEGTAAALSKAVEHVQSEHAAEHGAEHVIVLYSDIIFDFDLQAIINYHEYNNNAVTLAVTKTDNPSEHMAALEEDGIITALCGDLPRESCLSNLAVTGVMVMDKETAAGIAGYGEDILSDCIPRMLREGVSVGAYTETGFWVDINTPQDYMEASYAVLRKGLNKSAASRSSLISATADISDGAVIDGGSVIGENVSVARGAKIHGGIIMQGAYIGERATVNQAIVGEGARVLSSAGIYEGAVIGGGAVIGESAVIAQNIRIWNGRQIQAYAYAAHDVKYGFPKPLRIDGEGITGETGGLITPQTASVLGSAMAGIGGVTMGSDVRAKIGIGHSENHASKALAYSVASGVMAAGGEAWFFNETSEPELSFCVRTCGLSAGCHIDAGVTVKMKFTSSDGLQLSGREEKIIEAGLNRSEYRRAGFAHFGEFRECRDIRELYAISLRKECEKLSGIRAVVNTSGGRMNALCGKLLSEINDKNGEPIVFHISSDGRKISAYTEETGYVLHEKLMLLCCRERFRKGMDAALPYSFPTAADKLAERYGSAVLRYSGCAFASLSPDIEKTARELAVKTPFVYDAAALMLNILSILSHEKTSLKRALEELPEFASVNRFVALNGKQQGRVNAIEVLRALCNERQVVNDGVVINDNRGRVLISPVKTGKGVMMHVESYRAEIAAELCDFYQDLLTERFNYYN